MESPKIISYFILYTFFIRHRSSSSSRNYAIRTCVHARRMHVSVYMCVRHRCTADFSLFLVPPPQTFPRDYEAFPRKSVAPRCGSSGNYSRLAVNFELASWFLYVFTSKQQTNFNFTRITCQHNSILIERFRIRLIVAIKVQAFQVNPKKSHMESFTVIYL